MKEEEKKKKKTLCQLVSPINNIIPRHLLLFPDRSRGRTWKAKSKDVIKKRVPMLKWLPKYQKSYILQDIVAGLTVWLTAVPQSLAYAGIAGLTPEYGLYSQFVGPFVYILLGSCRQMTIGPTAIVQLFTYQKCGDNFPQCVVLMGFYSGIVELVLGVLQLGFLVSFISEPVTIGFTAGAVIIIASGQFKNLLGVTGVSEADDFLKFMTQLFTNISTIRWGDATLGVICLCVLVTLRTVKDMKPPSCGNAHVWRKLFWVLGLTRNALVVFVSSLIAYFWTPAPPFELTGSVRSGFPPIGVPTFRLPNPKAANGTEPMTVVETLEFLGTGPLVVAFGAILQNIAVSKAFGHGQTIDATQEMLATGATNTIGGFFSSLPTSGSFARSAINDASGVKSPLGGLVTGSMILLSLGYLTPFFVYIPKASLAAVIIIAVIFLIEFDAILLMWRTSKLDFLCCITTIVTALVFGIEFGILIGVAVSLAILLLSTLRPSMTPEFKIDPETNVHFVLLKPDQGINFPSVDYIRDSVNRIARHYDNYSIIVIQCDKWTKWDFTAANALVFLTKAMSKRGISLVFYKCRPEWYQLLETFGLKDPPCCFHKEDLEDYFMQMEPEESNGSICDVTVANPDSEDSDSNDTEGHLLLESDRSFPNYQSMSL